ncbi:MAG: hypothetical protein NTV49_05790 [Kiritimatiellaeota bacterium]|nr:hypothetical protein [Kiritimatiellota bacterium]
MTPGKVKHAPAADGACLDCHQPHAAANPALLKKAGVALCYDCHDQQEVAKQAAHSPLGEASCTTCHNPHSAGFKALLKKNPADRNDGTKAARPSS